MLEPELVRCTPSGVLVKVHVPVAGRPLKVTLPVDTAQEGCTINPTTGAGRPAGCAGITTSSDVGETQLEAFLTEKLNVPDGIPEIVAVVVVPGVSTLPGVRLTVQLPAGSPESTTLPVATAQEGAVIAPTNGAAGKRGCGCIITGSDDGDTHKSEFETLKVYVVPARRPPIVAVAAVPDKVIPVGVLVIIQPPGVGNPLNSTEPIETVQVGCVIVPIIGAVGVLGCSNITTGLD